MRQPCSSDCAASFPLLCRRCRAVCAACARGSIPPPPPPCALTVRYTDLPHLVPPSAVGSPHYFVSHGWARPFSELVALVGAALAGAVPRDTFVWCAPDIYFYLRSTAHLCTTFFLLVALFLLLLVPSAYRT